MTRDELIAAVRVAIWDAIVEQTTNGWIDREHALTDFGMVADLDMGKVAEAAMDAVLRSFLTDPQYVITTPGSFEIGNEQ